jgi:serine/threonine protein kinase
MLISMFVVADQYYHRTLYGAHSQDQGKQQARVQKVARDQLVQIAEGSAKKVYSSKRDANHVVYLPKLFKESELKGEIKTAIDIQKTLRFKGCDSSSLVVDYQEIEVDGSYGVKAPKMAESLDKHLEREEPDLRERINLGWHLLSGVATLHEADRVHGDLKPDNFLLGKDERRRTVMKLSDFGKCRGVQDSSSKIAYTGNRLFAPPEGTLCQAGEVASAALILIHLLESGDPEGITKILQGRGRALIDMTRGVTPLDAKKIQEIHMHIDQLMDKLEMELIKDENHEPGRFYRLGGLLKCMTHPDPAQRPSMAEALAMYPTCV